MSHKEENLLPAVLIDPSKISQEALRGIVENFIMRSGTDYGSVEISHETKVKQVEKQILNHETKVVYDPNTESVNLMTANDFELIKNKET